MDKKTEDMITKTAFYLVLVGGLNWGLTLFDFNIVTMLGLGDLFATVIYGAIGVAAIWLGWQKFGAKKKLSF
jgi:uncharacterized membrane protein YuzA (DUF378 family)